MATPDIPRRVVAVIGGATAGAELAGRLAERGIAAVVFEQNDRPYGKIEDGLPKWHRALRLKEYEKIRALLSSPRVQFVPRTRIGEDLPFPELVRDWGFQAVVLANGAWRDRPLPIEGADAYLGKGLIYQNPFIYWFNHENEAGYEGPAYDVPDQALVVGGGLASLDVVKALMLERTRRLLAERGIETDVEHLEVKGIPTVLEAHGLSWEQLGVEGATLFYRRRVEDMPLMSAPPGADEARMEKIRAGRRRMLDKAQAKYLFKVEPLCSPDGLIVEDGRLVGLRFRRTKMEGGRLITTDESFERRGSCVISSIGSIPEPISGIEMKGELFAFQDWELGRLADFPTVFSAGNIVTGKGNIVASRKHAKEVAQHVIESYLGVAETEASEAPDTPAAQQAREAAVQVAAFVEAQQPPSAEVWSALRDRVATRQRAVGYAGDLAAWLEQVTPADME